MQIALGSPLQILPRQPHMLPSPHALKTMLIITISNELNFLLVFTWLPMCLFINLCSYLILNHGYICTVMLQLKLTLVLPSPSNNVLCLQSLEGDFWLMYFPSVYMFICWLFMTTFSLARKFSWPVQLSNKHKFLSFDTWILFGSLQSLISKIFDLLIFSEYRESYHGWGEGLRDAWNWHNNYLRFTFSSSHLSTL